MHCTMHSPHTTSRTGSRDLRYLHGDSVMRLDVEILRMVTWRRANSRAGDNVKFGSEPMGQSSPADAVSLYALLEDR